MGLRPTWDRLSRSEQNRSEIGGAGRGAIRSGWFAQLPAYQANFGLTRDLDPEVWDLRAWLAHR
jgi:hypothetical protein